jgi:hypothetical protein
VKTLFGFAVGALLSLGSITSAAASGPNVVAPTQDIEVIVVTAKRPAPLAAASQPIEEIVVTAKRPAKPAERTPPVMAIEMPKIELAVAEPLVIPL